jgi:hypothetical protein
MIATSTTLITGAIEMNHREVYPHQYEHELCGKNVRLGDIEFTVYRVFNTRFGVLACSEQDQKTAYPIGQLVEVRA